MMIRKDASAAAILSPSDITNDEKKKDLSSNTTPSTTALEIENAHNTPKPTFTDVKVPSSHSSNDAVAVGSDVIEADDEDPGPGAFAHLDIKAIHRKMDFRIVPMLTVLYLLSFLDRGNIGNANIEGLSTDLRLTGAQYNWCLTAFFFTYAAFEVPSNMVLKRLKPSIWLPTIMVAWGIVMTLMGLVRSYEGLLIARIFLGVAEAGLFPGVIWYISMWYTRYECQVRTAYFFSAASVAGAFSGLLAYGIAFMDGVGGLAGWRWIFILEGILTVVLSIFAYFFIYDFPSTAKFLTPEERAFISYRLRYDGNDDISGDGRRVAQHDKQEWRFVRAAFGDWQIWLNILVYWGYVMPLYGLSLFLPSIIKELGYTKTSAQLLTVPIYVTASILTVAVAYLADRKHLRSPFILLCFVFQLLGFTMCIAGRSPGVTYAGVFIAGAAIYPAHPTNVAWLSNNLAGTYKRAIGVGLQLSIGNLGGAAASNFYRKDDSPRYILGHALEIGVICMGAVAATALAASYRRVNAQRARRLARGEASAFSTEELSVLGDKAITFRYTL